MTVTTVELRPVRRLSVPQALRSPMAALALWRQRALFRRDLRRLAGLGDHMLRDIGLTKEQAARELAKPIWQS